MHQFYDFRFSVFAFGNRSIDVEKNDDGKWLYLGLEDSGKCVIVHQSGDRYQAAVFDNCTASLSSENQLMLLQSRCCLWFCFDTGSLIGVLK
jgi:hypothetical protein